MKSPKKTIDILESELKEFLVTIPLPKDDNILRLGYEAGRLRGLNEIEELREDYNNLGVKFDKELERWQERDMNELNKRKELESRNKELMEALKEVLDDYGYSMTIKMEEKIESLLKSLPN